jgi:hypothetical protein
MDYLRYYLGPAITALAVVGLALGGNWVWLGIGVFPFLLVLDVVLPADLRNRSIRYTSLGDAPLYLHFPLLVGLWALFLTRLGDWTDGSAASGDLSAWQVLGMALSVGWIGAVPTLPIQHELMHRRHWFPVALSKVMGTVNLDPNRDVGHKLTHHLDLCTAVDSDTPRRGQNIYSFMWQAASGAYKDAVLTNRDSMRKRNLPVLHPKNSLYVELGLLGALLGASVLMSGLSGLGVVLATMLFSKVLTEGFNFLQHYGLVRVVGTPIRHCHAWNHLGRVMRPLGVEITNHINHHFDSRWKYHELKTRPDGAQMPSAFLCFLCALVPPLWTKFFAKPLLERWDKTFATPDEQLLAMEANAAAGWPQWLRVQDPTQSVRT